MQAQISALPKVSVVIPCYRDAATLNGAIVSVLNQTYSNIEIIIVNDASPETVKIEEILCRYPEVSYIKNDLNVGLAATRNIGIKNSKGDFMAFLDADDEWHPRKLELQMKHIASNTVVACDVEEFIMDLPRIRVFSRAEESDIEIVSSNLKFSFQNYLTGASLLAPKVLLLKVGGYDESLRSCEDYDLWLRLLEIGVTLIHLRLPLYFYRFNTGGLSKNFNAISFWELEVIKRHLHRNRYRLQFMLLKYPIWMVWLIRHLVRASAANSNELRLQTLENAKNLVPPPFLYCLIKFIDILGVVGVLQRIFFLSARYSMEKNKKKNEFS